MLRRWNTSISLNSSSNLAGTVIARCRYSSTSFQTCSNANLLLRALHMGQLRLPIHHWIQCPIVNCSFRPCFLFLELAPTFCPLHCMINLPRNSVYKEVQYRHIHTSKWVEFHGEACELPLVSTFDNVNIDAFPVFRTYYFLRRSVLKDGAF